MMAHANKFHSQITFLQRHSNKCWGTSHKNNFEMATAFQVAVKIQLNKIGDLCVNKALMKLYKGIVSGKLEIIKITEQIMQIY